ncbi:hypothetical protein P4U90_06075 [Cytobacillus kochii]|uniref:capsular polysaccharide export protein, LipB/KpsS family n=1 Tax=Cytobacillus kochii TaxID=859143 RepID=UPI002E22A40E|nr:hypothetical protein [Cytobacillus kochii]
MKSINKRIKKIAKKILGVENYLRLSIFSKRILPKRNTTKTVAFLFGFSKWKHDFIKAYLAEYEVVFIKDKENYFKIINMVEDYRSKVFMVWGYKDRKRIKKYSDRNNIPYYRIEDGFIRSVQLGASKSIPISLCIDSKALYYDSSESSDLENILNEYDFESDTKLMKLARESIDMLTQLNISKYNNVNSKNIQDIYGVKNKRRILVIGQVEDDQSIKKGSKKKLNNNDLVILAKMENPDAEIIYKPHPDVLFGKRPMQSNPNDVKHIAKVISEPLSLTDSFTTIDHVYTITSLSGFEALLRGIPVTTLGAPFYSGWGLTDDRQLVDRRKRNLTVEQIFAAAYILYPKYLHPITSEQIDIKEAINVIKFMKDFERLKSNRVSSLDVDDMKHIPNEANGKIGVLSKGIKSIPHIQSFIKGEIEYNPTLNNEKLTYIAGWGRKQTAEKAIALAKKINVPYLALEDGFLRSVGLGVNGEPPLSICIDHVGIYYDATKPSRLENILNTTGWEEEKLIKEAQKAKELIEKNYLSKYNHAPMINSEVLKNNTTEERVLVVDQTLGDMSITLGLANQHTFHEMYKQARKDNPEAVIYVKTHPDVISGKKQGNIPKEIIDEKTVFIYKDCNPLSLIENMDKVYVVTSQLGFEALLMDKEVHCFGMPFYAGWGITKDRIVIDRRIKKRNFIEIFAASYLLYNRYINPVTGKEGTIFDVIEHIVHKKKKSVLVAN